MVMLLGAARHLAESRDFDGTVYFVFQPAEEHIGGAKEMIKDGLFKHFPADEVYGLHNHPALPLGMMATVKGPMLAQSDEFHITFKGKGGHTSDAASATDLVSASAEMALAIRDIAKNDLPQDGSAVLAACTVESNTKAANIMPAEIAMNGSLRGFDTALLDKVKQKIEGAAELIAQKYGATVTAEFKNGYPMLVNSDAQTDFAAEVAKSLVGDHAVLPAPKTLGVEDFAAFLQQRPGNFMGIGTGKAEGSNAQDLHTCKYDFNDAALPIGASYWVKLVEKALPVGKAPAANAAPTFKP
jgi:hippurate hydrolase